MNSGYFITGTDTNIGKTWVAIALMNYFKNQGKSVVGFKPVASGCSLEKGRLVNADALLLQEYASIKLDYDLMNPYAYELAVSPHIAGKANPVSLDVIVNSFNSLRTRARVVLIEGAGGWYSPINSHQKNSHLASVLAMPVIMVVAIKLGCINHALLTYSAIINEGMVCAGWVAVCNNPDVFMPEEIISSLKVMLDIPLIGVLPYMNKPDFGCLASALTLVNEF